MPPNRRFTGGETLYFISGPGSITKIGISRNVSARLSHLQVASPHPLSLWTTITWEELDELGWWDDAESLEADLHRVFNADRVSGEWFRDDPDLYFFVAHVLTWQEWVEVGCKCEPMCNEDETPCPEEAEPWWTRLEELARERKEVLLYAK